MRTIDNNKLIAEFMGYPKKQLNKGVARLEENKFVWGQIYYNIGDKWYREDVLQYHEDWNWLMKAVEKINDFNNVVSINQNHVLIINNVRSEVIVDIVAGDMLEATYNAVIEFIKYYNNEN